MSPTAISLLRIILRSSSSPSLLKVVLLDYESSLRLPGAMTIACPEYDELNEAVLRDDDLSRDKTEAIVRASRGNAAVAAAMLMCIRGGVPVVGYLDPGATIDLYLGTLERARREAMAVRFIADGCVSDDAIDRRNYETLDDGFIDRQHLGEHAWWMAAYDRGDAPLVTVHARALRNTFRRLSALVTPTETLKNIGLYDTLLSYFGELFTDSELRGYRTSHVLTDLAPTGQARLLRWSL